MTRKRLHYRKPKIGDLIHPIEHRVGKGDGLVGSGPYADVSRVGLVVDTEGLNVLVQFCGRSEPGPWYRRTNVIPVECVYEIECDEK